MQKRLSILLLFVGLVQLIQSQSGYSAQFPILSDSSQISLLTNTPLNREVYALFGHTAIRVKDKSQGIDYVFNYGLFDFSAPNFIYRFIKGETDYRVDGFDFKYYIPEYKERGVGITEQILNLSLEEKQKIFDALFVNIQPENKVYRYNFLYDNCSTRPRDIIANNIDGTIQYTPTNKDQTYRDLIHECVGIQPWTQFGIDLIIGADADKVITDRQKDFLPAYLMHAYDGATIKSKDDTVRNLVAYEAVILEPASPVFSSIRITDKPLLIGIIFLSIMVLVSFVLYKKNVIILSKIIDTLLFITYGLAGCVIFFLMFFSIHPCVSPNWNIVWLNPLQIIVALLFFVKSFSKYIYCYHFINFVAMTIFLLAWGLIPQQMAVAFIPFILLIWLRSGMNILQYKKLKKSYQ